MRRFFCCTHLVTTAAARHDLNCRCSRCPACLSFHRRFTPLHYLHAVPTTLQVAASKQQAVADAVEQLRGALRTEYGALETGLTLELTPLGASQAQGQGQVEAVVAPADAERLLALLRGLPHGPLKYSHAVPGGLMWAYVPVLSHVGAWAGWMGCVRWW